MRMFTWSDHRKVASHGHALERPALRVPHADKNSPIHHCCCARPGARHRRKHRDLHRNLKQAFADVTAVVPSPVNLSVDGRAERAWTEFALLLAVAFVASSIPSLPTPKVDPVIALRHE